MNSCLLKDKMILLEDFCRIMRTVVAAMAEKARVAEERSHNPFANRANRYRNDDGQPICYCCLRVGHVAKYCWHRKYSCHDVLFHDLPQLETSIPVASSDVEAVGTADSDSTNLLRVYLHEIYVQYG